MGDLTHNLSLLGDRQGRLPIYTDLWEHDRFYQLEEIERSNQVVICAQCYDTVLDELFLLLLYQDPNCNTVCKLSILNVTMFNLILQII